MRLGKPAATSGEGLCATSKMSCGIRGILIGLSLVVFALMAGAAAAQNYVFNSFRVEGNQRIQTATIVAYTGIEPGTSLSGGELNDAYRRVEESMEFP